MMTSAFTHGLGVFCLTNAEQSEKTYQTLSYLIPSIPRLIYITIVDYVQLAVNMSKAADCYKCNCTIFHDAVLTVSLELCFTETLTKD